MQRRSDRWEVKEQSADRSQRRPGDDVAGVMDPDGDSGYSENCRHRKRQVAGSRTSQDDRNRDRECGGRVIARKRRVHGRWHEQMGVARIGRVRARPLPQMGDHLRDAQREGGTETGRDDPMPRICGRPFSARKEENRK